jgi:hypothetical protein
VGVGRRGRCHGYGPMARDDAVPAAVRRGNSRSIAAAPCERRQALLRPATYLSIARSRGGVGNTVQRSKSRVSHV